MASSSHERVPAPTARAPSPSELIAAGIAELRSRGRLIVYLVSADLRRTSSNTLLGQFWWVLDPLLHMVVYTVLVTIIFSRRVPDYPVFVFAALLPWKWFSSSIEGAMTSVTARERLIRQVRFPKLVLPSASVLAATCNFGFGCLALALVLLVAYRERISPLLLLVPLVAVVQLALTFGLALLAATSHVFFRDLHTVARHALRLWFYLSPVLWSFEAFFPTAPPSLRLLQLLNPFYPILTGYRDLVYYGRMPDWPALGSVLVAALILAAVGMAVFKRLEPSFAKVA